jgi:DNA-binding MarR family transcriptional regulator
MDYTPTLDHLLCFSVYAASIAITRTYKPLLDELGITYPQYLVLNVLWEDDGKAVGGIAERLSLESSTVTPLVKRLEAAGLVTRMRSAQDERQVVVSLTAQGTALRDRSRCLGEALLSRSGMEPKELMALNGELRRLRQHLASDPSLCDAPST